MEKDWVIVFETPEVYLADTARAILAANGIEAVVMNKKDRVYNIGTVEVYVNRDDVIRGKKIISELEN